MENEVEDDAKLTPPGGENLENIVAPKRSQLQTGGIVEDQQVGGPGGMVARAPGVATARRAFSS